MPKAPENIEPFVQAVAAFGATAGLMNVYFAHHWPPALERLTREPLLSMASALYDDISQKRLARELYDYSNHKPMRDEERKILIIRWFLLCEELAKRGIEPFSTRTADVSDPPPPVQWHRLPKNFEDIRDFIERFGHIQFDDEIAAVLAHLSESESELLRRTAIWWQKNANEIDAFLDGKDIQKDADAARIYFLAELLVRFSNEKT